MEESRLNPTQRVGNQPLDTNKSQKIDKEVIESYDQHLGELEAILKSPLTKDRRLNGEIAQTWLNEIADLKYLSENSPFSHEMSTEFKAVMKSMKQSGLDTDLSSEAFSNHYNEVSRDEKVEHLSKWQKQEEFAPTAFASPASASKSSSRVSAASSRAQSKTRRSSGSASSARGQPAGSPAQRRAAVRTRAIASRATSRTGSTSRKNDLPVGRSMHWQIKYGLLGTTFSRATTKMTRLEEAVKVTQKATQLTTRLRNLQNLLKPPEGGDFKWPPESGSDLGAVPVGKLIGFLEELIAKDSDPGLKAMLKELKDFWESSGHPNKETDVKNGLATFINFVTKTKQPPGWDGWLQVSLGGQPRNFFVAKRSEADAKAAHDKIYAKMKEPEFNPRKPTVNPTDEHGKEMERIKDELNKLIKKLEDEGGRSNDPSSLANSLKKVVGSIDAAIKNAGPPGKPDYKRAAGTWIMNPEVSSLLQEAEMSSSSLNDTQKGLIKMEFMIFEELSKLAVALMNADKHVKEQMVKGMG